LRDAFKPESLVLQDFLLTFEFEFGYVKHRKMRASPSKLARIRSFDLPNQTATSFRPLRFVLLAELEKLSKRKIN
jgi:hypothetical protein